MVKNQSGSRNRFAGRIALVAGGAHGIGLATARQLGVEGARVVVVDASVERLASASSCLRADGIDHVTHACDLADPDGIDRLTNVMAERDRKADVLFSSVGVLIPGGVLDMNLADWRRTLEVNVLSAILLARMAVPSMLAAGTGSIVFTSSTSGLAAEPGLCAYGASKAALNQVARQLAAEFGHRGVRTNVICPGWIDGTGFNEPVLDGMAPGEIERLVTSTVPMRHQGQATDVSNAACYLLSEDAAYVNGHVLCVDGGEQAL